MQATALAPFPALSPHSCPAHRRPESEWEWNRCQGERPGRGLTAGERRASWEKMNAGHCDGVRRHLRLVEQVQEALVEERRDLEELVGQRLGQVQYERGV